MYQSPYCCPLLFSFNVLTQYSERDCKFSTRFVYSRVLFANLEMWRIWVRVRVDPQSSPFWRSHLQIWAAAMLIKLTLPSTQKTVVAVCVSSKHFYSKSPLHKFMSSLIDRRVKYKTLLVRCRNEKKHNNDMQCTGTCAQSQTSLHAETYLEGVYHRGPWSLLLLRPR